MLEKSTAKFIEGLKGEKPIYKHTPEQARAILEKVQSAPVDKLDVAIEEKRCPGKRGTSFLILRPRNTAEALPVILYIHGAGWVMGSAATHDRLVRELAVRAQAAVIFVNYALAPEAHFPVAIEQIYAVCEYVAEHAKQLHLDASRFVVAGDSVGGNMSIALTLLAKERKGFKIDAQLLFYPVTSAELNTSSYTEFADGPWLTKPAMQWFWNAYEPDAKKRKNPLLSPLHAPVAALKGLPPALVLTAENDVLRDEGEQYASRLMQAGIDVTAMRFLGTIHDFLMLNALAHTPAAETALACAAQFLHTRFAKTTVKKKAA
jgi:acetyl esterase